jgi:hypothetical protein
MSSVCTTRFPVLHPLYQPALIATPPTPRCSIGDNVKLLVDRPDGSYCFRNHLDRVYYVRSVTPPTSPPSPPPIMLVVMLPSCSIPMDGYDVRVIVIMAVLVGGLSYQDGVVQPVPRLAPPLLSCADPRHCHAMLASPLPLTSHHTPLCPVHREDIMKRATNFGRENLLTLGTRLGKFSKKGKFRLHITALAYLAPYAKFKVNLLVPSTIAHLSVLALSRFSFLYSPSVDHRSTPPVRRPPSRPPSAIWWDHVRTHNAHCA